METLSHDNLKGGRQFRLLKLTSGEPDRGLSCTLHSFSVDDAPEYDALSYVWGDVPPVTILVDEKELAIPPNLEALLREVQLFDQKKNANRFLWADSICINQLDETERTVQVGLMKEIYKNCRHALLWFGPLGDVTPKNVRALFDYFRYYTGVDPSHSLDVSLPALTEIFETMDAMLKVGWWHRVWTIQEVLLPKCATVLWGSESCTWGVIENACIASVNGRSEETESTHPLPEYTYEMDVVDNLLISHVIAMHWTRTASGGDEMLPMEILFRFRRRLAKDPRDKVLGLLGTMPMEFRSEYNKRSSTQYATREERRKHLSSRSFDGFPSDTGYNLSVPHLFARVAFLFLRGDGLLALVGRHTGGPIDLQTPGLPSWVMDWVEAPEGDYAGNFWNNWNAYRDYNCTSVSASFEYDDEDLSLSLEGFKVDVVTQAFDFASLASRIEAADSDETDSDVLNACSFMATSSNHAKLVYVLEKKVRALFDFKTPYVSGCSWNTAFWRTMTSEYISTVMLNGGVWDQLKGPAAREHVEDPSEFSSLEYQDDCELIGSLLLGSRTMFVTANGYLGIGATYTSVGDELWVLLGGLTPFILRPESGFSRSHIVIGDCFAHGIMYGESMVDGENMREITTVTLH